MILDNEIETIKKSQHFFNIHDGIAQAVVTIIYSTLRLEQRFPFLMGRRQVMLDDV